KYHLFFQHNPKSSNWGNMTWGRATSRDMLHWTQHDHALLPYRVDRRSGTIFSGTAIVDHNNSLGKQVGDVRTLCAFFTFANQPKFYQAMAYSTDRGETWTYWNEGRAVVPNQGFDSGERDPKVFWHEPSQRWVMFLWVQRNPGRVRIFTSQNLTDWEFSSDLMRDWAYECMDVFFAPVDGDPSDVKCVIYDASFDYEIGRFDGRTFHREAGPLVAGGGNFYAAQTLDNHPENRTVQIGWMRGGPNAAEHYDLPHNQQMSFPCDLTLRTTDDGLRLFAWPIAEIESLVETTHAFENVVLDGSSDPLQELGPLDLVDLSVELEPGTAKRIVFELSGAAVTYDAKQRVLKHQGVTGEGERREEMIFSDLEPRDGSIRLRMLVDRLSLETFAFGGERFKANYYRPVAASESSIKAVGGDAVVRKLVVRELKSIW
ncbi:MAG: glycoside hydrolase family 32 protein, partial [Planctomycetota bacterium]